MRDLGPPALSETASAASGRTETAAESTRMVVAIFQRDQAAWFFKISGPPEKVASSQPDWGPFIDAVKFESASGSERPVWDLPDRWSLGGKAQMVFAILKMPDTGVEVRISRLGGQQDLLSNVNRWRGQLGLPPTTEKSIDSDLAVKQGVHAAYRLFDQQGQSAGQSMGGPFIQQSQRRNQKSDARAESSDTAQTDAVSRRSSVKRPATLKNEFTANPKFTFDPPSGYTPGKTSAMVVARFVRETDEGKVQISVVPLTATNQWNDNVNFWRQSVGMKPADEATIEAETETVVVSGVEGKKTVLLPGAEDATQSLVGVMVKHADAAWFFKMIGEDSMVKSDRATFDTFLKSFKFTDAP